MRSTAGALSVIAAAVVSSCVLSGCAQPGYNAQKLQRQLVKAGATPRQAECVISGLQYGRVPLLGFDLNELASHSDPPSTEITAVRTLLRICDVRLPPPASTPTS